MWHGNIFNSSKTNHFTADCNLFCQQCCDSPLGSTKDKSASKWGEKSISLSILDISLHDLSLLDDLQYVQQGHCRLFVTGCQ